MLPLPIIGLCTSSILPISPGCARGRSLTQALQIWCHEGLLLRPPHMPALRLCSERVSPEVCRDQVLLFDALKRAPVVSPSSCQFLHICPCTWALQGVAHVRPPPEGRCTLGECGGRGASCKQGHSPWASDFCFVLQWLLRKSASRQGSRAESCCLRPLPSWPSLLPTAPRCWGRP